LCVENLKACLCIKKKKQTLTMSLNSAIGLTWDRLEKSLYEVHWEEAEPDLSFD